MSFQINQAREKRPGDEVVTSGVLGKTPLYLAVEVSFIGLHTENYKKNMCLCFKMVFFRGQKKVGPRPDWSHLG